VSAITIPFVINWFGRLAPDVVFVVFPMPITNSGAGVY
jgi:hypothetical protein